MALVYYHRGNKFRPELDEFRLGIQKAREAIDNSIGNPKDYKFQPPSSVRPATVGAVPVGTTALSSGIGASVIRPSTQAPSSAKDNSRREGSAPHKSEKVLLGELYSDKVYLESLISDKDFINNPNNEICTLVSDALKYLDTRTEFWRQQKPIYARRKEYSKVQAKAISDRNRDLITEKSKKFHEKHPETGKSAKPVAEDDTKSRSQSRPGSSKNESIKAINAAMNVINGGIFSIAIERGDLQDGLNSGRSLLSRLNNMNGLDNRERAISDVLSTLGNICLELDNLPQAMQYHRKDLSQSRSNGLVDCISRALGNIGRTCVKLRRYDEAITSFEKKLVLTQAGTLERAWLLHDIGRCHLELGRDERGVLRGKESLAIAETLKDKRWVLNAHVLIAQGEARSGRIDQALTEYSLALQPANDLHDTRAAEAITKALENLRAGMVPKSNSGKANPDKEVRTKTSSAGAKAGPLLSRPHIVKETTISTEKAAVPASKVVTV
ncbi:hypothetical protein HDU67_010438 [Dinochytrium kinnereticum]|nr:hypothetical protein HDU67_010438 [Dinochytrium kinnereticum]